MLPSCTPAAFDASRWQVVLADIARRHHVPGIIAGVLRIDRAHGAEQRFVASSGVTNLRTQVASTNDTVCQIGSITKIVTATMIMQLREEGKLDLETPIADVLTDLRFADACASGITIRHLLTHTSGVDGDVLVDMGRGDDCIQKYVGLMRHIRSLFGPGRGWSYCNTGWALAGRVIEVLDGHTWDESVQERISDRLGLRRFLTLPEQIMSVRSQHGHIRESGKRVWSLAPVSSIVRSMGPAGGVSSSADDLLDFGATFLRSGRGRAGDELLSPESVRLMTETQVALDQAARAVAPRWGLGWMLDDWGGHRVYWHLGTTIGNYAWLHVLPDAGLVSVVFCNGGAAEAAGAEVFTAFAREFAGATPNVCALPSGHGSEVQIDASLLGRYADFGTSLELLGSERGVLRARITYLHESGEIDQQLVALLATEAANQFVARADDLSPWARIAFATIDGQQCAYLDMRCLRRQEDSDSPVLPLGTSTLSIL